MGKTLFIVGLTLCSLAASPTPTTKPSLPSGDDRWLRDYARRFGNSPTIPTTRPSMRDPIDGMPNALPRQFDQGIWPPYHARKQPSTNPAVPFLKLPDATPSIPPGWQRFKFNGDDVYIIPLKERAAEVKVSPR